MKNEPMSAITHVFGFLLAIAALVILIVKSSSAWHVVGFSIFGVSLILLYLASSIYHFIHVSHKAKKVFQKIDHAMIYVLIAGTYTPVCLTIIRGAWGWSLFGVIWGLAILGIILKSFSASKFQVLSALSYLFMGWLAIIAIIPLKSALPFQGFIWLILGGILYTLGIVFFAIDSKVPRTKWFGMHEVFHLFVLAGSTAHFWMMFYI